MKHSLVLIAATLASTACGTNHNDARPTQTVTVTQTQTVQTGLTYDEAYNQCYFAHENETDANGQSPPAGLGQYCQTVAKENATQP